MKTWPRRSSVRWSKDKGSDCDIAAVCVNVAVSRMSVNASFLCRIVVENIAAALGNIVWVSGFTIAGAQPKLVPKDGIICY